MPKDNDYPRCETCEHYRTHTEDGSTRLREAKCKNGNPMTPFLAGHVPHDFGCALHSDLESTDE